MLGTVMHLQCIHDWRYFMNESDVEGEGIGDLAHDLYWSSDRSVNSIADELGLSKGGLYQHILPIPTAGVCPRCGGGVGYFNRTARERSEPTCLALCDNEESFPVGGAAALLAARRRLDHASAPQLNDPVAEGFDDEVAFDLEGGFAEIAGLAESGRLSRADFESDHLLDDPLREKPSPQFLEKLRSPLSNHEKKIVAGALLAGAAGLLFLRLARR
jgi:hypothetical protein